MIVEKMQKTSYIDKRRTKPTKMLITILVFYRVIECLPLNSSETIIFRLDLVVPLSKPKSHDRTVFQN